MTNENKKDEGGPAFPIPIAGCNDGGVYNTLEQSCGKNGGMSLRDYFAGQALANSYTQHTGDAATKARWAYNIADAMLEARKK